MKIAPVSGDLLVKLAAIGGGVLLLAYLVQKAIPKAGNAARAVGQYLNPLDSNNGAYSGVNALGGAIVTDPAGPGRNADGSWSLGAALYDLTHANPLASPPAAVALPIESQPPTNFWGMSK